MPNPYAHGSPADPVRDFAGREQELRRVRDCFESTRRGSVTHVFIEGDFGIGKTSLLSKLTPEFQEHGPVISEDLSDNLDQEQWFYSGLFSDLVERQPDGAAGDILAWVDAQDRRGIRKRLKQLWDGLQMGDVSPGAIVVMLDNLERARPEFLAGVRDVFQRLAQEGARYMLIFAGKHLPGVGETAADPVGRFFNPRLVLRPFTERESVEAVMMPVRFVAFSITEEAARLIHERSEGHPYFLKLICHETYERAGPTGVVDVPALEEMWPDIEEGLETSAEFGKKFGALPEGEQVTLLHASLLGAEFEAKELRKQIPKSLDTYLSRLVEARGLLRNPARGRYQIYHQLFRTYLSSKAQAQRLRPVAPVIVVPEGRPVLGRQEVEARIAEAAVTRLDIIDQHFRGRAVTMLEAVGPSVRVRILMGDDPQWGEKTLPLLGELELGLRKRIEVRAWPQSAEKPVPWHFRCLIGDKKIWRFDHSLDGAGKKLARFTDDTMGRKQHELDFKRWWQESEQVFPPPKPGHSGSAKPER